MRKRAKQIYGILLSMGMLLTLLSVPVWAAEPIETGAGYEQEQEQMQEQEQSPRSRDRRSPRSKNRRMNILRPVIC